MQMSRLYASVVAVAVRLSCSHICALVRLEGAMTVRQPKVSEGNALKGRVCGGRHGEETL
jgi:hypothetical protein